MFKCLSFSCLLVAMIVPSSVFAAKNPKVGYIREPHGAEMNSKGCDDAQWEEATVGGSFRLSACFKTNDGGSVKLELKGSENFLSIGENSLINVSEFVEGDESGKYILKTDVKQGFMHFKAERGKGHEATFRTGTAAASIRGTEGVIGSDGKSFFAGLKESKLAVQPNDGDSLLIGEGETVVGREKFVVLKLKSSGEPGFAKTLYALVTDTTKSFEEMMAAVEAADKAYQDSIAATTDTLSKTQESEKVNDATTLNIPQIKYTSYDSLRCVANVTVSDVQKGTEARLSTVMDGTPLSEVTVKRNVAKRLGLRSGVHEYEFVVQNDAGKNSVTKKLGCYPLKSFSVKVFGKSYVSLQVPPPPPNSADIVMETLQFQIRTPEHDPSFLNKVTVRQNGKVILQERLSQIQNLDYQIPVELKWGRKTRFDIEVVHKNGYRVNTAKVYGVGI